MKPDQFISELESYAEKLSVILMQFTRKPGDYHIQRDDDPIFRAIVFELIDLLNDELGINKHAKQINNLYCEGISNFTQSPSFKSIEDINTIVNVVTTRIKRNPGLLEKPKEINTNKNKPEPEHNELSTVPDIFFNSNYKVKLTLLGLALACFLFGVTLGQSALYKEKIAPSIRLFNKTAMAEKNTTEPRTPKKITELTNK